MLNIQPGGLDLAPGKAFAHPVETVAAISKAFLDAGDVSTIFG